MDSTVQLKIRPPPRLVELLVDMSYRLHYKMRDFICLKLTCRLWLLSVGLGLADLWCQNEREGDDLLSHNLELSGPQPTESEDVQRPTRALHQLSRLECLFTK